MEWETTVDLNIKGALWAIAAVLPVFMRQQRRAYHRSQVPSTASKCFSPGGARCIRPKNLRSGRYPRSSSRTCNHANTVDFNHARCRLTPGIQHKTAGSDSKRMREIYKNAIPPEAVAQCNRVCNGAARQC